MKPPLVLRGLGGPKADPPAPSSRGPETPPTQHNSCALEAPGRPASVPLFVSVSSFFTNNRVRRAAPDLGSLAPIPRPSLGAGLVSPAQPWSPHMVPITVPLSPVSALAAWAHARGEGLPPHPPCPRLMLRYGPQISAQPFVTTGQSLLPPELLAAGLISDLHRAGARAPGLSWGGGARGSPWGASAGQTAQLASPHPSQAAKGAEARSPVAPLLAPSSQPGKRQHEGPQASHGGCRLGVHLLPVARPGVPLAAGRKGRLVGAPAAAPAAPLWPAQPGNPNESAEGPEDRPVGLGGGGVCWGDSSQMVWPEWAAHPLLGAAAVSAAQESVLLVLARPGPPSQRFHESQGPCCGGLLIPGDRRETEDQRGVLICPSPGPTSGPPGPLGLGPVGAFQDLHDHLAGEG